MTAIETQIAEAEVQADAGSEGQARNWRPSRRAEHHIGGDRQGIVVEEAGPSGVLGFALAYLTRPFVKLVIGLGIFILAAIVYDATINFGSWTEKAAPATAAEHKGSKPIPLTPE